MHKSPRPQSMDRDPPAESVLPTMPFPYNRDWPLPDDSSSLMPLSYPELKLVSDADFFAAGNGPKCSLAGPLCGPAGCCPCRNLVNDPLSICCLPLPPCCPTHNLICCFLYNACCGVSRGVFTGLPDAVPCNPCCCFPCQCCSTRPAFQCGMPCDFLVCCLSPEERCMAIKFQTARIMTAAAQQSQYFFPSAPGYPPVDNLPAKKAPATRGYGVSEQETYRAFWDESRGGWVVPKHQLLCGLYSCERTLLCEDGAQAEGECHCLVPLCGEGPPLCAPRRPAEVRPAGPWGGSNPNQFAGWFEAFVDCATAVLPVNPICDCYYTNACCGATKNVRWVPASNAVGKADSKMVQASRGAKWGGIWVFPKRVAGKPWAFLGPPTPCGTLDPEGKPLPTNVPSDEEQLAAGVRVPSGNRVLVYIHGGAYAVGNAQMYMFLTGFLLAEQTGQVVFMPEYPMDSSSFYPEQIDVVAKDYVTLMRIYGASNVVLLGESAGSNLVLASVANATSRLAHGSPGVPPSDTLPSGDFGGEPPAAMVLISPWVSSTDDGPEALSFSTNNPCMGGYRDYGRHDFLPPAAFPMINAAYATKQQRENSSTSAGAPASAFLVSPVGVGVTGRGADGLRWKPGSGISSEQLSKMCPVFMTYGEGEVLCNSQQALRAAMQRVALSNARFARGGTGAPMLFESDCFVFPDSDPAAAHFGGVLSFATLYYSGCGPVGRPTTSDHLPLQQYVRMFRFIQGLEGWGAVGPLSPITTGGLWPARLTRPRNWTDGDWEYLAAP